jgi:hypothetical protein
VLPVAQHVTADLSPGAPTVLGPCEAAPALRLVEPSFCPEVPRRPDAGRAPPLVLT